jgi:hypothetical protein
MGKPDQDALQVGVSAGGLSFEILAAGVFFHIALIRNMLLCEHIYGVEVFISHKPA